MVVVAGYPLSLAAAYARFAYGGFRRVAPSGEARGVQPSMLAARPSALTCHVERGAREITVI